MATSQGALVLSVAKLAETISRCPTTVLQRDVDALTACVADAFPPVSDDAGATPGQPHAATQPAGELFLKANVFLYAEPWARAGRRRIYLNDTQGTTLGYKDLNASQVSVTGDADPETYQSNSGRAGLTAPRQFQSSPNAAVPDGRSARYLRKFRKCGRLLERDAGWPVGVIDRGAFRHWNG